MNRVRQIVLVVSSLLLSWLLMQVVHELGHMVAAIATGGRVARLELHPLRISRTDVEPNPHPVAVVWGGPLFGAAFPMLLWGAATVAKLPRAFLRFFAGFCLIANGAYIGFGSFQRIGDCGEMLRHGSPIWLLWLFGVFTIPIGLWTCNGIGEYFGIGANAAVPSTRSVLIKLAALVLLVIAELALAGNR